MPIEQNGQKLYTPREVAERLGISVGMLRYLRNEGRIHGTQLDTITLYTEEQIKAADLSQKKRGPKTERDDCQNSSGDAHVGKPVAA